MTGFRVVSVCAAIVMSGVLLSGCGDSSKPAFDSAKADRSSVKNTVTNYLKMLEKTPHPGPDNVLPFVSAADGGKDKVRIWLTQHPKLEVSVTKYSVSKPHKDLDKGPHAVISVAGKVCPTADTCTPYPSHSGDLWVVNESGEYLLPWQQVMKFLGGKK